MNLIKKVEAPDLRKNVTLTYEFKGNFKLPQEVRLVSKAGWFTMFDEHMNMLDVCHYNILTGIDSKSIKADLKQIKFVTFLYQSIITLSEATELSIKSKKRVIKNGAKTKR